MPTGPEARVLCIGGAVLDRKYRAHAEIVAATSNPVEGLRSHGGVSRNVTENLARLGVAASFLSAVGDDEAGRELVDGLAALGVDVAPVLRSRDVSTAEYVAVLDPRNDLALGLAAMGIFEALTPQLLETSWFERPAMVFTDCNPPADALAWLVARARQDGFRLAVDTVSTPKAVKLPEDLTGVSVIFTNLDEAAALLGETGLWVETAATALVGRGAAAAVVTAGAREYAVADAGGVTMHETVRAAPVDITGAGDAMIAGTLYAMLGGEDIRKATRTGALLAALTIENTASVRADLSPALLAAAMTRLNT